MSVVSAILDLAKTIEEDADELSGGVNNVDAVHLMLGYVMVLKTIASVAEPDPHEAVAVESGSLTAMQKAFDDKGAKILAKRKVVELEHQAQQEAGGAAMAELTGWPDLEGTFVRVESGMPVGAFIMISVQVFQMGDDRKLHYRADKSKEYRDQLAAARSG